MFCIGLCLADSTGIDTRSSMAGCFTFQVRSCADWIWPVREAHSYPSYWCWPGGMASSSFAVSESFARYRRLPTGPHTLSEPFQRTEELTSSQHALWQASKLMLHSRCPGSRY